MARDPRASPLTKINSRLLFCLCLSALATPAPAIAVLQVLQTNRGQQPNFVLPGDQGAVVAGARDGDESRPVATAPLPPEAASARPLLPSGLVSLVMLAAGLGLVNMLSRRRKIVVAA
jgi:hypothetical protein